MPASLRVQTQQTMQATLARPATLFPRPQPAPELRDAAGNRSQDNASRNRTPAVAGFVSTAPQQVSVAPTADSTREVVLASPYTPGVRVTPRGHGLQWHHRNLRVADNATTLDTARAIARRAAERFDQMRDRMAKLDAHDADLTARERDSRRTLLPVGLRPPRIIAGTDLPSQQHARTKSVSNYLRPRLVRRPLGNPPTLPPGYGAGSVSVSVAAAPVDVTPRAPQESRASATHRAPGSASKRRRLFQTLSQTRT